MALLLLLLAICGMTLCSHGNVESNVTLKVTTRQADSTTYPPRRCVMQDQGLVTLNIDFISYYNPSDSRATGRPCDPDTSCDIFFEICISRLNQSDCGLHSSVTEVVASNTIVSFSPDIGGQTNPISIMTRADAWRGVKIDIGVWDMDSRRLLHDQVDEFRIRYTDEPGSYPKVILASGERPAPKSRLYMIVRLFCPTPTTTTTTTTTTPTTTTTFPTTSTTPTSTTTPSILEGICRSAIVFNETERSSRTGITRSSYIRDLGTLYSLFQPWFRFDGSAGRRLYYLSSGSPAYKSCGTAYPIYTSSHPTVSSVGTIYPFTAYGRSSGNSRAYTFTMQVMLCPNDNLIYKYTSTYTSGHYGFCGSY